MSDDQGERPMPYVVTTRRASATRTTPPNHNDVLSRREVATLEEAREAVARIADDADYPAVTLSELDYMECALSDSGGTVGPLPDGTVIEVTRA